MSSDAPPLSQAILPPNVFDEEAERDDRDREIERERDRCENEDREAQRCADAVVCQLVSDGILAEITEEYLMSAANARKKGKGRPKLNPRAQASRFESVNSWVRREYRARRLTKKKWAHWRG